MNKKIVTGIIGCAAAGSLFLGAGNGFAADNTRAPGAVPGSSSASSAYSNDVANESRDTVGVGCYNAPVIPGLVCKGLRAGSPAGSTSAADYIYAEDSATFSGRYGGTPGAAPNS